MCDEKTPKKTKLSAVEEIIIHGIIFFLILILIPLIAGLSDVFNEVILKKFSIILGQNSEIIGSYNLGVTVATIALLFHYSQPSAIATAKKFLRFLFLMWAFIIPNELLTVKGWDSQLLLMQRNSIFVNLAIFPFLCLLIGIIYFSTIIICKVYQNNTEEIRRETEEIRKKATHLRSEIKKKKYDVRLKKLEGISNKYSDVLKKLDYKSFNSRDIIILLSILVIGVHGYAVRSQNTNTIIVTSIILCSEIVLLILVKGGLDKPSKLKEVAVKVALKTKKGASKIISKIKEKDTEISPKHRKDHSVKKDKQFRFSDFVISLIQLGLLSMIVFMFFVISSGTFSFHEFIKFMNIGTEGSGETLIEMLTNGDLIANFIAVVFIFIVILFGAILIFFIVENIIIWAFNGKLQIDRKDNPDFFLKARELTTNIMELIVDSANSLISLAQFIPDFFMKLRPVVFEHNADELFEICGTVTDINNNALAGVGIIVENPSEKMRFDEIPSSLTDSYGNYYLSGISRSATQLMFHKDGYRSASLPLQEGVSADVKMETKIVVRGKVLSIDSRVAIANVEVMLEFNTTDVKLLKTTTLDDGSFKFIDILETPQYIICDHKDYVKYRQNYGSVSRDEDENLVIELNVYSK